MIARLFILTILLISFGAGFAGAADKTPAWSLSADTGVFKSDDLENGKLTGLRLGYDLPRKDLDGRLLLEAVVNRAETEDESGADATLQQVRLEVLNQVSAIGRIQFLLAVGAGAIFLDGDKETTLSFGGGVMCPLTHAFSLRADARNIHPFSPGIDHGWEMTAGLMYVFGQEKPKPVPPLPDKDKDGVQDRLDRCADTPPGVAVDTKGCPTDTGDKDGDKVQNYRDRCPDTLWGVKVDEWGCEADDGTLSTRRGRLPGKSAPASPQPQAEKAEPVEVMPSIPIVPLLPEAAPTPADPVELGVPSALETKETPTLSSEKLPTPDPLPEGADDSTAMPAPTPLPQPQAEKAEPVEVMPSSPSVPEAAPTPTDSVGLEVPSALETEETPTLSSEKLPTPDPLPEGAADGTAMPAPTPLPQPQAEKAEPIEVMPSNPMVPVLPGVAPIPTAPIGRLEVPLGEENKEVLLLPSEKLPTPEVELDPLPDGAIGSTAMPLPTPLTETELPSSDRDSDGDGVTDRQDQCPGTPVEIKVNEEGCAGSVSTPSVNETPGYRQPEETQAEPIEMTQPGVLPPVLPEAAPAPVAPVDRLDVPLAAEKEEVPAPPAEKVVTPEVAYRQPEETQAEPIEMTQPGVLPPVLPEAAPAPVAPVDRLDVPLAAEKEEVPALPAEKVVTPEVAYRQPEGTQAEPAEMTQPGVLPPVLPEAAPVPIAPADPPEVPLAVEKEEVPALPAEKVVAPEIGRMAVLSAGVIAGTNSVPQSSADGDGVPAANLYRKFRFNFDHDKWKLLPAGEAEVLEIIEQLRKEKRFFLIKIEGHTDAVGADTYNLRLSQKRAMSVGAALIKAGFDSNLIFLRGYGEARPVADNDSADGRAENRRVDVFILPKEVSE